VQSPSDVDDVAAEWVDRFGPVPEPAANLLQVAYLRAECVRTGVTEVNVTKSSAMSGPAWIARLSPVTLPQSKQTRLARLYQGAVYKDAVHQLQLPVQAIPTVAEDLVAALRELLPPPVEPVDDPTAADGGTGSASPEGAAARSRT
jgi:transcription-repair coupling factor (superfamily II helicase)